MISPFVCDRVPLLVYAPPMVSCDNTLFNVSVDPDPSVRSFATRPASIITGWFPPVVIETLSVETGILPQPQLAGVPQSVLVVPVHVLVLLIVTCVLEDEAEAHAPF